MLNSQLLKIEVPHIMFVNEDEAITFGYENLVILMDELKNIAEKNKDRSYGILCLESEYEDEAERPLEEPEEGIFVGWFMNTFSIKVTLLSGSSCKKDLETAKNVVLSQIGKYALNAIQNESKENILIFERGSFPMKGQDTTEPGVYLVEYEMTDSTVGGVVTEIEDILHSNFPQESTPENNQEQTRY